MSYKFHVSIPTPETCNDNLCGFNYQSNEANSNRIQLPTTKNVRGHILGFKINKLIKKKIEGFRQLNTSFSMPKNNMKSPRTK